VGNIVARRRRKSNPDDLRSIRVSARKDGTVVYKPYIYDPARQSGKRWLGTHEDLGDAQAARDEAAATPRRSDRDLTVDQVIELYLTFEGADAPTLKTRARYRAALKPVRGKFGRRYVDDITRAEARLWGQGQPVSVTDTARTMFNWAITEEVASRNPFGNLGRPRPRGRSDIKVLDEEELLMLGDVALTVWGSYGVVIRALILVAGYTGMRLAELFGLRWQDIDMRAGVIHVRWQLETMGSKRRQARIRELRARKDPFVIVVGGLLTRPKNHEPRTILLLPEAADALRDLPRRLDSEFVFLTTQGRLFSKSNHHRCWAPVRAAFAMTLPPTHWLRQRMEAEGEEGNYDFHELRHLHSSILDDAGVSERDNAQQLGQKDGGRLVRERYAHRDEDRARERTREQWDQRDRGASADQSVASRLRNRDETAD